MEHTPCDERLIEVEQRSRSNTKRIDKLEHDNEVMQKLITSVEVMATKMDYMCKSQDEFSERLASIEDKPEKRLDQIVSAVIVAIIGLAVGYLFGGAF